MSQGVFPFWMVLSLSGGEGKDVWKQSREARGGPWEAEPLGPAFGLFHIKNSLTAHTAQPLSWRGGGGVYFFKKV